MNLFNSCNFNSIQSPPSNSSHRRDLASARMQLRGIVKQTEDRFGRTPTHGRLAATLEEIEAARAQAAAAKLQRQQSEKGRADVEV